jgi:hypothetical protein
MGNNEFNLIFWCMGDRLRVLPRKAEWRGQRKIEIDIPQEQH